MIVAPRQDGVTKGVVCGDIDTAFVCEDAGFNLPVSQLGTEGKGNVLMHGLEGLEDEGVTRGSRFNAVREGGVDEVNEKGWWEEGYVSVVRVVCREEIRTTGKSIGSSKELSGDMDHLQVEVGEVDEPAGLAAIKRLRLAEIGKVFVVGKDLYREGGTMEIMAPRFQGANDGEEFSVIDIVVPFGGRKGLR